MAVGETARSRLHAPHAPHAVAFFRNVGVSLQLLSKGRLKKACRPRNRGSVLHHNRVYVRFYWVIALLCQSTRQLFRPQGLHWLTTAVLRMRDHQPRTQIHFRLHTIFRSPTDACLDDLSLTLHRYLPRHHELPRH